MGERKGTNKYYPPDYDPSVGGLNKFLGTHALRERARKIHMGIIIVRFEMPFNIWCEECKNHIGMGVRYNAEKKKVGMYYSTPVYQFRMKCHLCDNYFEIKTDPGNLTYEIISGAKRQDNRWDPLENEQIVPEEKETSCRLYDDAMFKIEHNKSDVAKTSASKSSLSKLIAKNEELWKDDYATNYKLRMQFRKRKNEEKLKDSKPFSLKKSTSLSGDGDKEFVNLLLQPATKCRKSKDDIKKSLMKSSLSKNVSQKLTASSLGIKVKEQMNNNRPVSLVSAYDSSSSD